MKRTYQLLISTMNQNNLSLVKKMRVSSDAIIINQCDHIDKETIDHCGNKIQFYSFNERGVGLSRNSAMMRATADIIEFADDDMIFTDSYREDVLREFEAHPEADAILFSVESLNPKRPLLKIHKFARVRRREALKYGCARLAIRREKVLYNNIAFSLLFGGGAKYGSGEDTLFLQDCLRAGLRIYKSPVKVADITQEDSTWFHGYTEKYFTDKGALFAAAMPKMCYAYALATAMCSSIPEFGKLSVLRLYVKGICSFKKRQRGGDRNYDTGKEQ